MRSQDAWQPCSRNTMPAERAANAPIDESWLPVSHAAAGQVPIAPNLWGAGRRTLAEAAPATPPADGAISWLGSTNAAGASQLISDTSAGTIPANAEASLSAWGSTVRFTPAPTEFAQPSPGDGAGRSASYTGPALVGAAGAEAAAESRYAAVWNVMSPGMRALAVAEENQRWGGDTGRNDTHEVGGATSRAVHTPPKKQPLLASASALLHGTSLLGRLLD